MSAEKELLARALEIAAKYVDRVAADDETHLWTHTPRHSVQRVHTTPMTHTTNTQHTRRPQHVASDRELLARAADHHRANRYRRANHEYVLRSYSHGADRTPIVSRSSLWNTVEPTAMGRSPHDELHRWLRRDNASRRERLREAARAASERERQAATDQALDGALAEAERLGRVAALRATQRTRMRDVLAEGRRSRLLDFACNSTGVRDGVDDRGFIKQRRGVAESSSVAASDAIPSPWLADGSHLADDVWFGIHG